MEIFLHLSPRILPLYLMVYLGYFASKNLKVEKESFAKLSIYILVPFVMFYGVMNAGFSLGVILIPVIIWAVSCAACLIVFKIGKIILTEKTQTNILALAAGTGNSGYFGLPVAMIIFDEKGVGVYLTTVLGMTIFQNTIGYYMTSIGNYSAKESFRGLLKLPVLYAFVIGTLLNSLHFALPEFTKGFFESMRGAYIVIGMMIIGAGLAGISKFAINIKFTVLAFAGRYLIWPLMAFSVYFLDSLFFGLFNEDIRKALVLASAVPLAADTVAFAALLKCHPEEMASAVVLSSLFALFYIPFIVAVFM